MKLSKIFVGVAALLASTAIASAASAAVVTIQTSYDGGGIVTQSSTAGNVGSFVGAVGVYNLNVVTGIVNDIPLLQTTINDGINTAGDHSLDIFVTAQFYNTPLNVAQNFLSTFNTNFLTNGWSVADTTWLSKGNLLPSAGSYDGVTLTSVTMLGSGGLLQSSLGFNSADTGTGPYALTTEFHILSHNDGSVLSTTAIAAVPEPATWGLMLVGFGGAGALLRNRRRAVALAA
jgi:hypothetical protein